MSRGDRVVHGRRPPAGPTPRRHILSRNEATRCAVLLWVGLSAALVVAACGVDAASPEPPEPLEISALSPAPGVANVETGATVAVVFNQAIDLATLTSTTFLVKRDGVALPVALSYDAATRTARAVAPLLPGVIYEAEVTTGVRTSAGSALGASNVWSFTTRRWQATRADGGGGDFTSLALGAGGRLHISYRDANAALKYATCAAGCELTANWQSAKVDSAGSVGEYTSLAVDAGQRLHVSYFDYTNGALKYATCALSCEAAANWQSARVDSAGSVGGGVGGFTSLAVGAGGRLHVSYYDFTNRHLKYATCAANCEAAANWQATRVDTAENVGGFTSLAVAAGGRLHVSYRDGINADLKYATCAASCEAAANWHAVTVDAVGDVGDYTSLAVDAGGRLHVSYWDYTNGALKYATCAVSCEAAANWQAASVDTAGNVGLYPSLAVDARGRLHVSYYDGTNGGSLKYATCAASCELAANWQAATVDAAGNVGGYSSLAVDAGGRLHISYWDFTNGALKYIE